MKILIIITFLLTLTGCAIPHFRKGFRKRTPYRARMAKKVEKCVIRMLREGVNERIVFKICHNIYRKRYRRKIKK